MARETGLSKPTVSLALAELVRAGLVREVGRTTGGKGPSAVLYELNPQAGWVVGIDVGREYVRAAIADITGTIVARRDERARVRSAASLIGQIGEIAHSLAGEAGPPLAPGDAGGDRQPRRPGPRAGRRGAGREPAGVGAPGARRGAPARARAPT